MADQEEKDVDRDYSLLKPEDEGTQNRKSTARHALILITDALHKSRLLPIEQRPFQRLNKRLISPDSPFVKRPIALAPPISNNAAPDEKADQSTYAERAADWCKQFREEMLLDFALFENSITRIQLLRNQNEAERRRYADEKVQINERAQAVRENIINLRQQLQDAQARLALRKEYDALAEKITSNRMLKPRGDQEASMEKLQKEIAELEREKEEYGRKWVQRRIQFGMIVKEGKAMLDLIKSEKEEAERKEGMEGGGDDGEDVSAKGQLSAVGTPKPDTGGTTPLLVPDGDIDESGKADEDADNEDVKMGDANEDASENIDGAVTDLEEGEAEDDIMETS